MVIIAGIIIRQNQQYSRLFVKQCKSLFGHLESLRQPPLEPLHGLLCGEAELKARARGGVDVQVHRGRARLRVHSRACDACRTKSGQSVPWTFPTAFLPYYLFSPDTNQALIYSQKGVGTRKRLNPTWGPWEGLRRFKEGTLRGFKRLCYSNTRKNPCTHKTRLFIPLLCRCRHTDRTVFCRRNIKTVKLPSTPADRSSRQIGASAFCAVVLCAEPPGYGYTDLP